jgi:hypothetical protein
MKTRSSLKFASYATAVVMLVTAGGKLSSHAEAPTKKRLIVHEWGTFTSVSGEDGVSLDWRPLVGHSDLPSFVYEYDLGKITNGVGLRKLACPKCSWEARVRMETPVIYFYADEEMAVSVNVWFPQGKISEWYPQASSVRLNNIDWGVFKVIPGANPTFPTEESGSHYYAARATDSAAVRVCSVKDRQFEMEKFLFYRGVGTFDLPLSARLEKGGVTVQNTGKEPIAHAVLFENREGKIGFVVREAIDGEIQFDKPNLDQSLDSLIPQLAGILTAQGLYEKEAQAMIETWRDQWFEEGTRVFYILPRATTDRILPIHIQPAPDELQRVLVGRIEVITPEQEAAMLVQLHKLGDDSRSVRENALTEIKKRGRFAEPVLRLILTRMADPEIKARIHELLDSASANRDSVRKGS